MKKYIDKILMFILLSALLATTVYFLNEKKQEEVQVACDVVFKKIYLAQDETYLFGLDDEIISNDENVVIVNKNKIVGVNAGSTTVTVNGCKQEVEVSDLYTIPIINNSKPFVGCQEYSYEDNLYLDMILEESINTVGYHTRAGVVEAARFLTLRFKNKIKYFYENGRLDNDGIDRRITDGEGRYYHKGLYLSNEKTNEITPNNNGPQIWGCDLYENYNKIYNSNGLDCSGFVAWAMYNAGFDVGDIGAGPEDDVYDLTDTGEKIDIEKVDINKIKVGDLLGFDGHIAIIIGKDQTKLYIANMYWDNDLEVLTCDCDKLIQSKWEYVIMMDNYYKEDGLLTDYWN